MSWIGVITNTGKDLFKKWIDGTVLNIVKVTAGTGTVPEVSLMAQTSLVDEKQVPDIIIGLSSDGMKKIKIQIPSTNDTYTLNQMGIYATLDNGEAALIAIYQNKDGVVIPSVVDSPEFVYTFYCYISVSNRGDFSVSVNSESYVTVATVAEYIGQHSEDEGSHPDMREQLAPFSEIPSLSENDQDKIPVINGNSKYVLRTPINVKYASPGLDYTIVPYNDSLNPSGPNVSVSLGTCTDKDIVFPDTYAGLKIVSVPNFANNVEITSLQLPKYGKFLGRRPLGGCTNLKKIVFPEDYEGTGSIDMSCFSKTAIENIKLPKKISTIGNKAFSDCKSLKYIILDSDSIVSMGSDVFSGCDSLQYIFVKEHLVNEYKMLANMTQYAEKIYPYGELHEIWVRLNEHEQTKELPETTTADAGKVLAVNADGNLEFKELKTAEDGSPVVKELPTTSAEDKGKIYVLDENGAPKPRLPINQIYESEGLEFVIDGSGYYYAYIKGFGTCTDETVVFPKDYQSVPVVGTVDNAGAICSEKTRKIVFPDGLTRIGSMFLMNDCNVEEIELPSTLTFFDSIPFSCPSIKRMVCHAETPPSVTDVLNDSGGIEELYVPEASVYAYKSQWSQYVNNVYPIRDLHNVCKTIETKSAENDKAHETYQSALFDINNRVVINGEMKNATRESWFVFQSQVIPGVSAQYKIGGYYSSDTAAEEDPSEIIVPQYTSSGIRIGAISSGAFEGYTKLERLIIRDCFVESGAFIGCDNLKEIVIMNSNEYLTPILDDTFPDTAETIFVPSHRLDAYKSNCGESTAAKIKPIESLSSLRNNLENLQNNINSESLNRVAAEVILQGNINNSTERSYLVASLFSEIAKSVVVPQIPMHTTVHVEVLVRHNQTMKTESDIILVPYFPDIHFQDGIYRTSGLRGLISELLVTRDESTYSFYFNTQQFIIAADYSFISARIRVAPSTVTQLN